MEEDGYEQDTSITGRLLMLVNKIKGQSHKSEEPTEKQQAAPCEDISITLKKCNHVHAASVYPGLKEEDVDECFLCMQWLTVYC